MLEPMQFTVETGKSYDFPGSSRNARFNGEPVPELQVL